MKQDFKPGQIGIHEHVCRDPEHQGNKIWKHGDYCIRKEQWSLTCPECMARLEDKLTERGVVQPRIS